MAREKKKVYNTGIQILRATLAGHNKIHMNHYELMNDENVIELFIQDIGHPGVLLVLFEKIEAVEDKLDAMLQALKGED